MRGGKARRDCSVKLAQVGPALGIVRQWRWREKQSRIIDQHEDGHSRRAEGGQFIEQRTLVIGTMGHPTAPMGIQPEECWTSQALHDAGEVLPAVAEQKLNIFDLCVSL